MNTSVNLGNVDFGRLEYQVIAVFLANADELEAKGIIRRVQDEVEILDLRRWNDWWDSYKIGQNTLKSLVG